MLLARLSVTDVSRPSPSFARLEFAGPDLTEVGVEGPFFDQRIKLIFPGPAGLPDLNPDSWWSDFTALPEQTRGSVRTYTIAALTGEGDTARLVVDFVLHPGAHGPGSAWALSAATGDEILAVLPRRGVAGGGIEFAPGDATRVLLVGDETALPAIVQIVRDLPVATSASIFVEVPVAADEALVPQREGVTVTWLARDGAPIGDLAVAAVAAHLGFAADAVVEEELQVDPDLWETPMHSSSGESLEVAGSDGRPTGVTQVTQAAQVPEVAVSGAESRYAWIAGESKMVTRLRRHLVGELGMPRTHVAFMGYWREGVAMRG